MQPFSGRPVHCAQTGDGDQRLCLEGRTPGCQSGAFGPSILGLLLAQDLPLALGQQGLIGRCQVVSPPPPNPLLPVEIATLSILVTAQPKAQNTGQLQPEPANPGAGCQTGFAASWFAGKGLQQANLLAINCHPAALKNTHTANPPKLLQLETCSLVLVWVRAQGRKGDSGQWDAGQVISDLLKVGALRAIDEGALAG